MKNKLELENYLSKFGDISKLDRQILLKEMDSAWDDLGIDNTKQLSVQSDKVASYYSHPVWTLNGLYSELDPVSKGHRVSIALYLQNLATKKIADYGGGSGVLAKLIAEKNPDSKIHIVEPFVSDFFQKRIKEINNIMYVSELNAPYDVLIAQDVLEHVDDPIGLTLKLIEAVSNDGYLIFANCFYPDIKCHLPSTFYLRHQFKNVVAKAGLTYLTNVPGAGHALVFQKTKVINYTAVMAANKKAKILGSFINKFTTVAYRVKQVFKKNAGL